MKIWIHPQKPSSSISSTEKPSRLPGAELATPFLSSLCLLSITATTVKTTLHSTLCSSPCWTMGTSWARTFIFVAQAQHPAHGRQPNIWVEWCTRSNQPSHLGNKRISGSGPFPSNQKFTPLGEPIPQEGLPLYWAKVCLPITFYPPSHQWDQPPFTRQSFMDLNILR